MGLLSGLLGLPVAPLRGVVAVADQVLRQAEDVYYDPAAIRAELEEVDRLRATGAVSAEEAEAWEDELSDRLMESSRRRGERER
jgi:Gas vesicle protein G